MSLFYSKLIRFFLYRTDEYAQSLYCLAELTTAFRFNKSIHVLLQQDQKLRIPTPKIEGLLDQKDWNTLLEKTGISKATTIEAVKSLLTKGRSSEQNVFVFYTNQHNEIPSDLYDSLGKESGGKVYGKRMGLGEDRDDDVGEEEGHKGEETRFYISYVQEVEDAANYFEQFTLKEHSDLKDQSLIMSLKTQGEKNEETIKNAPCLCVSSRMDISMIVNPWRN